MTVRLHQVRGLESRLVEHELRLPRTSSLVLVEDLEDRRLVPVAVAEADKADEVAGGVLSGEAGDPQARPEREEVEDVWVAEQPEPVSLVGQARAFVLVE